MCNCSKSEDKVTKHFAKVKIFKASFLLKRREIRRSLNDRISASRQATEACRTSKEAPIEATHFFV